MGSLRQLLLVTIFACTAACAGTVIGPKLTAPRPASDALLVLPGFGYTGDAERVFKALARLTAAEGIDLYAPSYIARSGLAGSRANVERFLRQQQLGRYTRVHVFAFIAGAWTINPLVQAGAIPNLATVVYDRSPLQERAPQIATDDVHFLTWLRYGSPVFELARTPYPPMTAPNVKVGLLVETDPSAFIRDHEAAARRPGPFRFECDALLQRHDDCAYVAMNHNELYVRFAEVWPELLAFIRTGRFTAAANRTPPTGDPFARAPKR
jgi:hypothetical protein